MTGRWRTGRYAIGAVVGVAVVWLGVRWRHAERAPVTPSPARAALRPPVARRASAAEVPRPATATKKAAAAPTSPVAVPATASPPNVDWDATPVLDSQDPELPTALRQGIADAAFSYFHGAGRQHQRRPDCWKRYPPPANAPQPIRLDLELRMRREDGRLVIAGVGLDHANFDLGALGDCLARSYAAFQPVALDAPGVEAGPPFRTELHVQQYTEAPEDNGDDGAAEPPGPLVAMDVGGVGKTPDCPAILRTSKPAGAPCRSPMDCAEVCCGCPANDRWFATSVCDQGRCVGGAAACKVALARPAGQLCAAKDPKSTGP